MKKLLLLRPFCQIDMDFLASGLSGHYQIAVPATFDENTLLELIGDAEVAIGNRLSARLASGAKKLTVFQIPGTGTQGIDKTVLASNEIALSCSHSSAPLVAEHALAMLLSLIKRVSLHDRLMRQGQVFRPGDDDGDRIFMSDSLIGKTIGFLGFGRIAQEIAKRLTGFGASTIAKIPENVHLLVLHCIELQSSIPVTYSCKAKSCTT